MINLEQLKQPVKNVHFRPKTCVNGRVLLLAYLDSRDVMNILDNVVGPMNWQRDYKEVKGNLYAGIGINIDNNWVWKWDCGTESKEEKEKGESSDSFKRAAVSWGIGRYLYYLKNIWVEIKPKGDNYINIQDKNTKQYLKGYYDTPKLPSWATYKEIT